MVERSVMINGVVGLGANVDSKSTHGLALRGGGDAVVGGGSGGLAPRLSADAEHLRSMVGLRLRPRPARPDGKDTRRLTGARAALRADAPRLRGGLPGALRSDRMLR